MRRTAVILAFMAGLAWPGMAHEGHAHKVMGTVTKVQAEAVSQVEVKTTDGKTVVLTCDERTKFLKGKAAVTLEDVLVGSRIVATVAEEGKTTRATEVTIGQAVPAQKPHAH